MKNHIPAKAVANAISNYPDLPQHPTGLECRKWANNHPAAKTGNDRDILSRIAFLQSIDKACQGGAYTSYKKMAERLQCDQRTVKRRIKRFIDLGVILREKRKRETVDVYKTNILTVRQEGVTDHLEETGTVTVTNEYGQEIEVEREYDNLPKMGSDKYPAVVTTLVTNSDVIVTTHSDKQPPVCHQVSDKTPLQCHQVSDKLSPLEYKTSVLSDSSISDPKEYDSEKNTVSDCGRQKPTAAAHTWMTVSSDPITGNAIYQTNLNTDLEKIVFKDGTAIEYRIVTLAKQLQATSQTKLQASINNLITHPEQYDQHCKNADTFNKYLSGLTL